MRGTSTLRNMGMSSTLYGPVGDPPPTPTEAYRATFDMFIDPTAGTTFVDSSGNTQPAWATSWTENGNPTWTANGWVCDGVGDQWTSSGNPGTALDGGTLFVAFTVDSASGNEAVAGIRTSTSSTTLGWDIRRSSGTVAVIVGDGSGTENDSSAYTNDTFASTAVTFDEGGNDEILVYRDGSLSGTIDLSSLGTVLLTGNPLEVGQVASTISLNGTIHGLVWESSGLDATAISGLHTYFAGVASA